MDNNAQQTVYFGSDENSHEIKKVLKDALESKGIKFVDLGKFEDDDTEFAIIKRELGEKVREEANPVGVLIFTKKNNIL